MRIQKVLLLLIFISSGWAVQAQSRNDSLVLIGIEMRKRAAISMALDEGVELMEQGKFKEADSKFREVLRNVNVVPTNLTYYFGKNSYYLGKYRQSIDWLNKYIELKGTSGQYYQDCVAFLEKAERAHMEKRKVDLKEAEEVLASDYYIDCGPAGKVVCPVCKGKTVIITQGTFSNIYKTCPYSDNHGNLSCDEYNLLLRGELEAKF